ncbi:family 16 glycosylhydrolase [Phenylobacterium sp.]|jgi:beta-glucanase (GH16 family)|uniref:family 16 glycosylhydrolase n=1 Tax=Phenylobacterium sp. TaxID=1871053 RepID=UPI002F418FEC
MVGYTNYSGLFLPTSASYVRQIWATGTDPLYGPDTPSFLMGSNQGNYLHGGSGDDTIYAINLADRISGGAGVDTAVATVDFTLPNDVENLTMNARWTPVVGVGNDAANILVAQSAKVTLAGAGGDDVIVSAGGDTFVFGPGSGHDVVINFQPGSDVVRVGAYGFDSFQKVMGAMTQVGGDTLLRLSANDSVLFTGVQRSAFNAGNFETSVNTSTLKLTFDDEFNSLKLQRQGDAHGWATSYDWDAYNTQSAHTIQNESEIYVDPTFSGSGATPLGLNPFSVQGGVLTVTASQTPTWAKAALWGSDYTSGLITTSGAFAQTYGYFEMRADLPAGQGAFPAFWLLPQDGSYTGEIDVMETVNSNNEVWNHIHYNSASGVSHEGYSALVPNLMSGYHTFGVLWTPQTITWYVDGSAVNSTATPAALNKPMYMLADFAVGGSWAGAPDASAIAATSMKIDYIRAYSLDGVSIVSPAAPSSAPTSSTPAPLTVTATAPAPVTAPASSASLAISGLSPNVTEGVGGVTYAQFTVTRSGDLTGPSSAAWTVSGSGSSPANAADFAGGVLPGGTVFFGHGEISKVIWIPVKGDLTSEANESFTVRLSNPSGAGVTIASADGKILNDDGAPAASSTTTLLPAAPTALAPVSTGGPRLSIAATSAEVTEHHGAITYAQFAVTRAGDLTGPTTVAWTTAGSGAHAASAADFDHGAMPAGTVFFGNGESLKTIWVPVAGDYVSEPDEGFTITLANPTGGSIATGSAAGLIHNDWQVA